MRISGLLLMLCLLATAPAALMAAETVDYRMSGAWFDPSHNGEGFLVEVLDEERALVYWFTYDESGGQRWFIGLGEIQGDTIAVEELLAGSGAKFGENFDPEDVDLSLAGKLLLRWSSCDRASADFTVAGVIGQLTLDRLTALAGRQCGVDGPTGFPQSGSWFDRTRNGEGLVVEILPGDLALVFWLSYDPRGNPAWFYGVGDVSGDTIWVEEMFTTSGGRFGPQFDPDDVRVEPWGSLLVELGCEFGKMDYLSSSPGYGEGKHTLVRLTNPGGVACSEPAPPNILLVIADDVGLDSSAQFDVSGDVPATPVLDDLADQGLVFENAWSNPSCSPTRAGILTGKYGFRTGVLTPEDSLAASETSLQSYIHQYLPGKYSDAVIGKWHLAQSARNLDHPADLGIGYFAGLLGGGVGDYENWLLTVDGEQSTEREYVTSKLVDLAVDWIGEQDRPWFLWLAFNAPHTPFHVPPGHLHDRQLPGTEEDISENPRPYYLAAIEAMDTELGRLLNSMDRETRDNTIIVFLGDNGTPSQVVQAPYSRRRAKGSLYQGGIHVPLFISGAAVNRQGQREAALINTTDLFTSIASLAGVNVSEFNDSISFAGLLENGREQEREFQYSETENEDSSYWAVSDGEFKLIESSLGEQEFYDLIADAYENGNLLDGGAIPAGRLEELSAILDQLHGGE